MRKEGESDKARLLRKKLAVAHLREAVNRKII